MESAVELKIVLISVSDTIWNQLLSVLLGWLDAFTVDHDDVGYTRQIEHRIETGLHLPFRQHARPVPFARRIFIESELESLIRLGVISVTNRGE